MTERVEKIVEFLKDRFPETIQMFNCRNTGGDFLFPIYEADNVTIEYCPSWMYIEIFGLTNEEFNSILFSGTEESDPYLGVVKW